MCISELKESDGFCYVPFQFIVWRRHVRERRAQVRASAAMGGADLRYWMTAAMTVIVSPRSTASSRSEKCRDASVAVMVFMRSFYLIIRFATTACGRMTLRTGRVPTIGGARLGKLA